MDPLYQAQILYEIAMSIGTSLDMKKMMKKCLTVYLRKLGCFSGAVLRVREGRRQQLKIETVMSIPRTLNTLPVRKTILEKLFEGDQTTGYAQVLAELPQVWKDSEDSYYHLMELPGFGLMYISRSGKRIDDRIIKSLKPLNKKLSYACLACLQNIKVEDLVGERTRELSRVNNELYAEIAERKKTEAVLSKTKAEAERANRAKSDFLAKMSHEIRTPLNGIIGMTELLLESDTPENQDSLLQIVSDEANSLLYVINDILDFSKIEAGKLELETRSFDIRKTVDDLTASLALKADEKGVILNTFIPSQLETRRVGDPLRLRQILVNLISNAIKFTHDGEIFVAVDVPEGESSREKITIRFRVIDTGIGIPEEKQVDIFESFSQVDDSTTRNYGGTGLGVAICKQLVELMAGEIGVESTSGVGSTFWFTVNLPLDSKKVVSRDKTLQSSLNVLVIENHSRTSFVLGEYLSDFGCSPVFVSEELTLPSMETCPRFDILLVDEAIAFQQECNFVNFMKSDSRLQNLLLITMGISGKTWEKEVWFDTRISGHITKPIRKEELEQVILSVISLPGEKIIKKRSEAREFRIDRESWKYRILLVEDYPTNQKLALAHLKKAGYQVDLAENGAKAYEYFTRQRYDCVLMDIQMPVMDGYEATRKIRVYEKNQEKQSNKIFSGCLRTPIIAMTAYAIKDYVDECYDAGMDDFIAKPLRREAMLALVEKYVAKSAVTKAKRLTSTAVIEGSAASTSPIDIDVALDEFLGDREFLLEVLKEFTRNAEKQIEIIRCAIADGNCGTISKEAHALKGGAANLIADRLAQRASDLEKAGKAGELHSAEVLLDDLEVEYASLKLYLSEYEIPKTMGK